MKTFRKLATASAFALILSACYDAAPPLAPVPVEGTAELAKQGAEPNVYIVLFRPDLPDAAVTARALAARHGGRITHIYTAIKGMALELPDGAVPALRADPQVVILARDGLARVGGTQANPPWGLDRVDERARPLSGTYTYYGDGTGVTAFIIDTGIDPLHPDFGGRASVGFDATGGSGVDCNGHGTHVAGTVAGGTFGVAKNVQVVGVKVFPNCGELGNWTDIIEGVDWVTANKTARSVANMSLGGPQNAGVNAAVQRSINAGVTYAISAGNCETDINGNCVQGPFDACTRSPASLGAGIVVAATNINDQYPYFSNFGSCVSINAPGVDIISTGLGGTTDTMSGTSMASPHVAGTAALILQGNPGFTPAQIKAAIVGQATYGVISGLPGGTPNLLLFTLGGLPTSVSGPSTMAPGNTCYYYASASGGVGPYVYTWSWTTEGGGTAGGYSPSNGTFVLAAQTYANYTIHLTVKATDVNGAEGSFRKSVSVSTFSNGCT